MTFTEQWFAQESQDALAALYEPVRDLAGDVVEVGCWEGRSTVALATACDPEIVHAVDTWQGSPGEVSWALAEQRDVYRAFIENVAGLHVEPHRMGWRQYFADNQRPVKFLHIDATHTYQEVRDNILAALPLIVEGGVVCGDDVHHPPVRRAVLDLLPGAGVTATLWHWVKP